MKYYDKFTHKTADLFITDVSLADTLYHKV